ncbi:MAG: hypothetical protein JJE35_12190 [Thermoleophilia bacterium]|nr:hypothetical protein [Thermoleophilia bacterium]
MKRSILIAIAIVAACAVPVAHAEGSVTLLIAGSPDDNVLDVKPSTDGRFYIIDSMSPLEVGGAICTHVEGRENSLSCEAAAIAGFEVNTGSGNDSVIISPKITVPATLRGGPGNDRLRGGAGADKLIGGSGDDFLLGGGSGDWLIGGSGNDWMWGQSGDDRLSGGSGNDLLLGGPGTNTILGGPGNNSTTVPPGTTGLD